MDGGRGPHHPMGYPAAAAAARMQPFPGSGPYSNGFHGGGYPHYNMAAAAATGLAMAMQRAQQGGSSIHSG